MVIQQNRSQGRYINLELAFSRDMWSQFRIQGMNTFQNQNHVFIQSQSLAAHLPDAGIEVESRKFHFFPIQQHLELAIEKVQVKRIERFIIILPILRFRSIHSVHKIIIQRYGVWFQSVSHQLNAQTLAEGSLTGRRRSGNQNQLHRISLLSTMEDFIGNLRDALFLQGFGHIDQFGSIAIVTRFIEVSHRTDT